MSSLLEIESAIKKLPPNEFAKLSQWMKDEIDQKEKERVLNGVGGYLTEEDSDFIQAVEEASHQIDHEEP